MIKKLLCKIFGHRYYSNTYYINSTKYVCKRCGSWIRIANELIKTDYYKKLLGVER